MKKLLFFPFLLAFVASAAAPAFAARECYSPAELQAEQLLRLHSELMVIALSCKEGSRGQDLISAYTGFTHDNISILSAAEHTLIRYYEAASAGDGIANLDRLRTRLGNEYGQKIADVSAPVYCQQMRDKVTALYYSTPLQVAREIQHMAQTEKSYGLLCGFGSGARTRPVLKTAANFAAPANMTHTVKTGAILGATTSTDYAGGAEADLVGEDRSTNTNMLLAAPAGRDMDKQNQ